MTDEYGFEVGPNGVYEDRLEELLDRLELQEGGSTSGAPSSQSVALRCRPPVVLDGFRTGEYTVQTHHYARMLPLPLPAPVIVIRGHTDDQGDTVSNTGVSLSRAFEVLQWLTHRNGERKIGGQVIIEALGARAPVASNATEEGRSRNRRVEILLCQAPPPHPVIASAVRIQMGGPIA
jgi:hypothetical protein